MNSEYTDISICFSFAHHGEARETLESLLPWSKVRHPTLRVWKGALRNLDFYLLLTGEGPFQAVREVSQFLCDFPCSYFWNFGLVGALNKGLSIGDTYQIDHVYLTWSDHFEFQSFSLRKPIMDLPSKDLITSAQRVLNPQHRETLSAFADLVDRELWGVVFALKPWGIPISSVKWVVDYANSPEVCKNVLKDAERWSLQIRNFVQERIFPCLECEAFQSIKGSNDLQSFFKDPDYHFTQSMRQSFVKLWNQASDSMRVRIRQDFDQIRRDKMRPKDRARLFIQRICQYLSEDSS